MNVLVLRSSANGAASVSNQLVDRVVANLGGSPANSIVERNLDRDQVPHVHAGSLAGIGRHAPEGPDAQPARILSDTLIDEVDHAELIVIGAPMYNFSIPTTLKSWFDHVLRAGRTFQYGAAGAEGLMTGRRAIVLVARAGIYPADAGQAADFQIPYVRALLAFIGITDVTFVVAEGLAFGPEVAAKAVADALAEVDRLVPA
jgi:FMN-dependent NADH-azoreductase